MTLPTYDQFISPLLLYLADQTEPVAARKASDAVADRVGLSDEQRKLMVPSGMQQIYKNRIGWAHDRLKRSRLSSSPRRGHWMLTDAGRELARTRTAGLPEDEVQRIAMSYRETNANGLSVNESQAPVVPITDSATQEPEEQIQAGLAALRASVADDLLEEISRNTPEFFERLVLDLLYAMGYGESREALQQVGRSGDGGIDGIISLDRLGLQKVYVQAKRWQGPVGSPVVQGFMGALQLQGADRGVLITSGSISRPAMESAQRARGALVLVDGERLATLMIEHGVGVSHEVVKVPKMDTDYFEET